MDLFCCINTPDVMLIYLELPLAYISYVIYSNVNIKRMCESKYPYHCFDFMDKLKLVI